MQQQQQYSSAPQNAGGVSVAVGLQKGPEKKSMKSESQPKPTTVSLALLVCLLLAIYKLNSATKRSHILILFQAQDGNISIDVQVYIIYN
jgi:hypothetical protein